MKIPSRLEEFKPWFVRDSRLRAGWRVLLYIAVSVGVFFGFAQALGVILYYVWLGRGVPPDGVLLLLDDFATKRPFNYPDVSIAYIILRLLMGFGIIYLFRRYIDKRPFKSLGFQMPRGWHRELAAGSLFALGGWLVIFLLCVSFGIAKISGFGWNTSGIVATIGLVLLALFYNLLVGLVEEADARGYILQNLAEGTQFKRAVLISAVYFGAAHLFNPGAGIGSTVGIVVAGILLATGYYVTGHLWFSVGMHAAWNFAEGPLFGFPVSGLNMDALLQLKLAGPDWLIGGTFGPEAGLLAVLVELAMIGLLIGWKQGRLDPIREFLSVFFAGWGYHHYRQ